MYYRGKNNEIIEAYDDAPDQCQDTPLWLIILLITILVLVITFIIYSLVKKH
jgi:hypothetical protein